MLEDVTETSLAGSSILVMVWNYLVPHVHCPVMVSNMIFAKYLDALFSSGIFGIQLSLHFRTLHDQFSVGIRFMSVSWNRQVMFL